MDLPSRDPLINAINNGIRRAIDVAIDNRCFGAAVILIFATVIPERFTILGISDDLEAASRRL